MRIQALVLFYRNNLRQRSAYNAVLVLAKDNKWIVEKITQLADKQHPQISVEELLAAETVVKNNTTVQQLAKAVGGYALTS